MLPIAAGLYALVLLPGILTAKKNQSCQPYPYVTLDNGRINHAGSQKYSFHCNNGYFLASANKVRCYRGKWTSLQEPRCLRIEGLCDDPPPIDNGIIHGDDRHTDAKVTYTCKEGFLLMGKAERFCSRSGHWSGRTPVCMDESEPLQKVAERLKNSFVTKLSKSTDASPEGRLLDRSSLLHGLELVLLLDRSSSVDPVHLEDSKNFVKYLMQRFGVRNGVKNKSGTRAAILAFGTDVQFVFNVNNENITGPLAANKAIDTIQPNGGGTNMEGAMTQVILQVTPILRSKAKRALFIMTDGEPNIANPEITPQDMARQLKGSHEFEIFTVGIGKGINRRLLAELASEPPLSHVFVLDQYPDLNEIMKVIQDSQPEVPPISKDHCGYEIDGEDRPWLAVLYVGRGPIRLCGGILICSSWVLTAASCLEDEEQKGNIQDVFVTLGERDLLKTEDSQTNFYVTEARIHPAYDRKDNLRNNLALLKLNLPADKFKPACLPRTDTAVPLHLDLNINASIAGWGRTSGLGATPANGANIIFSMESTPASLAEEDECPGKKKGMALLCAGQGSQTCLGLTGSPLIASDPSTHFNHVIGILAGRRHCLKSHNQYIELTRHLRWINQQTDACQLKHWGLQD